MPRTLYNAAFETVVPGPKRFSPPWAYLHAAIPNKQHAAAISRAARWASYREVPPGDFTELKYALFKTEVAKAGCPEPDHREQMMRRALADLKNQGYAGPIPPLAPQRLRPRQVQLRTMPSELLHGMKEVVNFESKNPKTTAKNRRILLRAFDHLRSVDLTPSTLAEFWSKDRLAAISASGWLRDPVGWQGDPTALRYRETYLKLGQIYFDRIDRKPDMVIRLRGLVKSGAKRRTTINRRDQSLLDQFPDEAIEVVVNRLDNDIRGFISSCQESDSKDARWALTTIILLVTAFKPERLKSLKFSGPNVAMGPGLERKALVLPSRAGEPLEVGISDARLRLINDYCVAFSLVSGRLPISLFERCDGSFAQNSEFSNWVSGFGRRHGWALTPTVLILAIVRRIILGGPTDTYADLAKLLGISQVQNAKSRYQILVDLVKAQTATSILAGGAP